MGNFKAILAHTSKSDTVLDEHLKNCASNATYISKTALDCIRICIQTDIIQEIKSQDAGSYFGIMADEVKDVSNWEQLGIAIRYLKDGKPTEKLITYVECEKTTGEAIADKIIDALTKLGLDPLLCRSQTYDGAGAMAGINIGAAEMFKEKTGNKYAPYYHCASHSLNLVLSKACQVPDIRNMNGTITSLGVFLSNHRQRNSEHLN